MIKFLFLKIYEIAYALERFAIFKKSITSAIYTMSVIITVTNKEEKQTMTKHKEPRMPRKMKKRFKKLIEFYKERGREYKKKSVPVRPKGLNPLIYSLILGKLFILNLTEDDIAKIEPGNDGKSAVVTLKGSIKQVEITVEIKED